MTPKDKARELVGKFIKNTLTDFSDENFEQTKQCTLICVDEIMKYIQMPVSTPYEYSFDYWQAVKQEINKL